MWRKLPVACLRWRLSYIVELNLGQTSIGQLRCCSDHIPSPAKGQGRLKVGRTRHDSWHWTCSSNLLIHPRCMSGDASEGGSSGDDTQEEPAESEAKPPEPEVKPKRRRRREKYGSYGWEIEDELEDAPEYEGHLYNARGIVEKWLGDKTLEGMLPEAAVGPAGDGDLDLSPEDEMALEGEIEDSEPPGEGPILRWETRMILAPGPSAWHPANRKVKMSVTVAELALTPLAKERLLALVGRRYHSGKDELTLVSERFREREENRKDVLRTLLELIKEAKLADELATEAGEIPVPAQQSLST